jgi:splicing factor 3B subunit 1
MKLCSEEKLMGQLGLVLYEYLGEEYPEVLGSILGALKGKKKKFKLKIILNSIL